MTTSTLTAFNATHHKQAFVLKNAEGYYRPGIGTIKACVTPEPPQSIAERGVYRTNATVQAICNRLNRLPRYYKQPFKIVPITVQGITT